jgi:flavin-dependent dehydrogenase
VWPRARAGTVRICPASIWRGGHYWVLSTAFEKKFERYERDSNGRVRAFFKDGSHCDGDVLIGADGAGLRVRKQLLLRAGHQDTGIVPIGGKLLLTADRKALLNHKMFGGISCGAIIHVLESR